VENVVKSEEIMRGLKFMEARKKLGMTQTEIADVLDVDIGTVWRWENDRAKIPRAAGMVVAILAAEGVTADELATIWEDAIFLF
jgi:transcriptional regulator with XRE-family HTH domain